MRHRSVENKSSIQFMHYFLLGRNFSSPPQFFFATIFLRHYFSSLHFSFPTSFLFVPAVGSHLRSPDSRIAMGGPGSGRRRQTPAQRAQKIKNDLQKSNDADAQRRRMLGMLGTLHAPCLTCPMPHASYLTCSPALPVRTCPPVPSGKTLSPPPPPRSASSPPRSASCGVKRISGSMSGVACIIDRVVLDQVSLG